MKKETSQLLKEVGLNTLLSMAIFAVVLVFLFLIGQEGNIKNIAIASGLIGSAYVLIIRNPNNYFGFVLGIISSILLGIQFYQAQSPDLPVLYFFVFIPCQIITLYTWIQGNRNKENAAPFNPSFLSLVPFLLVTGLFVVLFFADLLIVRLVFHDTQASAIQVMSALVVASSILANFLIIKKKTDTWYYWVIFSIAGVILNILYQDYVTLTLFVVYTVINFSACLVWIKKTPKENYGWLKGKN